ncbi:MAG TPA: hypothetical protein ENN23_08095 [Deltaproteobacteria bacterium]|nr:hypothetical protein [Deltaproteobacteria bacterium]
MSRIKIKAGARAYKIIKSGGFNLNSVATYFGPAVGPRWLISSGFDLTLLKGGFLGRSRAVNLIGSSAGAWRFAAWTQPQALQSYNRLMEGYINTKYYRKDSPRQVLEKFMSFINDYLEDDALPFALNNKRYRLAIITSRARNLVAAEIKLLQKTGLAACFLLNCFSRNNMDLFAERVVFYDGSKPPYFCLQPGYRGSYVRLNEINFKYAIMASGAIPLIVAGVKNIYGAPGGVYRDGGLIDYHLAHQFAARQDEVALFFHHQERIIPGWLDKYLKKRTLDAETLSNVLMVYPSEKFIKTLPDEKVPDRTDFTTYIDDQDTRIRKWNKAVELAAPLGEEFLELVESGKIKKAVEKF